MRPHLEPYKGPSTRHECPSCHDRHSFSRYIDGNTGEIIHPSVGRCDHEAGCGYHYPPKQYFKENPDRRTTFIPAIQSQPPRRPEPPKEPGYIPEQYLTRSLGDGSNLVAFLLHLFDSYTAESPTMERLVQDYRLGVSKDKSVIYWQIDQQGRIRTGKIMQYNPSTGKRIKDNPRAFDWVHARLKRMGKLPDDFNLAQCLFGEHLLRCYPEKVVALVESEKSVLIGSGVFPDYVWLATGGRSQLSIDKLRVLRGRTVVMLPDTDLDGSTYSLWIAKAKELAAMGCYVIVSDLLERQASPADREAKIDLADWLIRQLEKS